MKPSPGQRVFAVFLLLLGIGFAILALVVASQKIPLIVHGVTTTGTVVEVDERPVRRSRQAGLVEFRDHSGTTRRVWSVSGMKSVGDQVVILYDPADPENAAEHSIATTWGAMVMLPLVGTFLIMAGRALMRRDLTRLQP